MVWNELLGGFSCAEVKYDNEEKDLVSLWDMKRLDESDGAMLYQYNRHGTKYIIKYFL